MARAKSERSRSKPTALDELTQNIEQLQAFLPKVEDLGRDGFPYLEGSKARTELQIRECIKRAFGDKSPEYQTHRQLKLAIGPTAEHKQSVALIKHLIATLEDKKLELQGLKPSALDETPIPTESAQAETAPPKMSLVPPTPPAPQVRETPVEPVTAPPNGTPPPVATAVETSLAPMAASTGPAPAPVPPPVPIPQPEPPKGVVPTPQSIAPEQVSSLFRPHETGSVPPLILQPQRPVSIPPAVPAPPPPPASASPAVRSPQLSGTQEIPLPSQPIHAHPMQAPSLAQTSASPSPLSATQEVPEAPPPVQQCPMSPAPTSKAPSVAPQPIDHLDLCRRLCQRFHAIARQLKLRGEYRPTVAIEDEIDVQDLLHALLRVQFDDIGTDEWTPKYSNDAPRTTYLLNHDSLAIVVKKTRAGLSVKELAEQLRLDIERYRTREQCTALFCFVYDPEGRIGNPRGLENDLAGVSNHFTVDVLVAPK